MAPLYGRERLVIAFKTSSYLNFDHTHVKAAYRVFGKTGNLLQTASSGRNPLEYLQEYYFGL